VGKKKNTENMEKNRKIIKTFYKKQVEQAYKKMKMKIFFKKNHENKYNY